MYNVTLLGASFETGNIGVSALAASLVKLIKNIRPEANISFFIAGQAAETKKIIIGNHGLVDINIVNFRLSPKASLGEHLFWLLFMACMYRIIPFRPIKEKIIESNWRLKTLATSDLIGDIRGGDSFSDIYGLKNLVMGSIPDIIILLLGKNLALLPQTYGPYRSKISKCIAKFIIRRASFIVSRDRESIETVNKLLDKSDKKKVSYFCPDVAFVLDLFKENKIKINPPLNKSDNISIIGFNISGLLYSGGFSRNNMFGLKSDYKEFVHKLAGHFLRETKAHLLLIPHTIAPPGNVESDPGACQEVFKSFSDTYNNRVHILLGEYNGSSLKEIIGLLREYNPSSLKGIISLCDFFIGSRMHACIAALSQGIPAIAIAYSKKFQGVFDSVNAADLVVDARFNDIENTIKYIMAFYADRKRISTTLNKEIQNAKLRTDEIFRLILH